MFFRPRNVAKIDGAIFSFDPFRAKYQGADRRFENEEKH
ncbi:hypothetical protein CSIRO_3024 [Bradyrhizobiaceae bacterium SG-6C]|nr:hypothetical protein CSIRO_3024 [Bradyrhizobiaceae bacterium SG-6C]